MAYVKLSDHVFDCAVCHTRCDGISKGSYHFQDDATFSEKYEQSIINKINTYPAYQAFKTIEKGYPDLVIKKPDGSIHCYLEVKVQQRTFMSVQRILPASKLFPSETVALNMSDLLRYFEIEAATGLSTSIVWVVLNRPCIVKACAERMFFQSTRTLKKIYEQELHKRRFRRRSGEGDVVDGVHKGVTVNYHFSLNELNPWL